MASILTTLVQRQHYRFADRADSWQEAVRLSAETLVADGSVEPDYYRQIVRCIEQYGPYVVFDHGVAMPHTQENADGVHKTGIGFLRLKEPVSFGPDCDGEEKTASLFFTLAACDPAEHLENIRQLAGLFCNKPLLDALKKASSPADLLAAEEQFPIEAY